LTQSLKSQGTNAVRAPSLTLTFKPEPSERYVVLLDDGSGGEPRRIGHGSVATIREQGSVIRNDLERIRKMVGTADHLGRDHPKTLPTQAGLALWELYKTGISVWTSLLGTDKGLNQLWRAVEHKSKDSSIKLKLELRAPMRSPVPSPEEQLVSTLEEVEEEEEEWYIPWEFLPLEGQPSTQHPSDKLALMRWARAFPAFRATLRHIPFLHGDDKQTDGHLSTEKSIRCISDRLPLLFLWYDGAPFAGKAKKYMEEDLGYKEPIAIEKHGPFPSILEYPSTETLAQLLIEQGLHYVYNQGGETYQLVHIHAHGETGERSSSNADTLRFAYYRRSNPVLRYLPGFRHPEEVPVTNGDLLMARSVRKFQDIPLSQTGPLIFLNVCGGTSPSFSGGLGLAGLFLKRGYRAVIGPYVSIPGSVAECMARYFYEDLLRECDIAEALFNARWQLLENYLNPLGALYTAHGESGLHLER
jgi:CHAT domain